MKLTKTLLVAMLATAACGKGKAQPPAPYAGAPTAERITSAKQLVAMHDDWAEAIGKLEAEAGPATRKSDDKAVWIVASDDACTSLEIGRKEDHISRINSQPTIHKADFVHTDGASNTFEDCVAAAHAK